MVYTPFEVGACCVNKANCFQCKACDNSINLQQKERHAEEEGLKFKIVAYFIMELFSNISIIKYKYIPILPYTCLVDSKLV